MYAQFLLFIFESSSFLMARVALNQRQNLSFCRRAVSVLQLNFILIWSLCYNLSNESFHFLYLFLFLLCSHKNQPYIKVIL